MSSDRGASRFARGVTLIEAVLVVLVLALTVPAAMTMITEGNESRRQSAEVARATTLAAAVLEQIIADSVSPDGSLGFAAFADASAYLSTATTGLYDRLDPVTSVYTDDGMAYTVSIGDLATAEGVVTGDADDDVFRLITVTVTFDDPDGGTLTLPVSVVLAELTS